MFRKLVSNLPFSPSLIHQVGFYATRLKKEEFTRKLSLALTALLLVIQSLTVFIPAKPTVAASTNDIIFGGGTKESILQTYRSGCDARGRCDIKQIFNSYGINEHNLAAATYETIYSSQANNYWSTGRAPRGYGGEVQHKIPGGPTIWARTLHGWKLNYNWKVLKVQTNQGVRWILLECGNIITKETVTPPPPDVEVTKTASKANVKKGEKFYYTITIKNISTTTARNVPVFDNAPPGIALQPDGLGSNPLVSPSRWQTSSNITIGAGQSVSYRIYAIATVDGPRQLENLACVDLIDANVYNNCDSSITTIGPPTACPYNSSLPADSPDCKEPIPCPYDNTLPADSPDCKEPVEECPFDAAIPKSDPRCQFCPIEGKQNVSINDPSCKPCDESKQSEDGKDLSCLELRKSAKNVTQQITDANGTTARPGDTIEYTLSVRNFSKETRRGFMIEENMEDVLEYADIIDASGAAFTDNPIKMLTWGPVDIKPNETISRTVLVKVKSEIPVTPTSVSDPYSHDLKMVNVYGDTVQINLPPRPIKTIEQTITQLPETGFGANAAITTFLVMAATYFYFRSRTMTKELLTIRQQFHAGGMLS